MKLRALAYAAPLFGAITMESISIAGVTPISASRSVGRPPVTGFGEFNSSFTDNEQGGGSMPAMMSVTMTQDSTIGDGTTSPFVSYYGLGQEQVTAGSATANFAELENRFNLFFQLTSPETLVHTFPSGPSSFSCTLTPSGGTTVDLLAPGANNINLNSGMYTLAIDTEGLAENGMSYSTTWTLTGTVSFIPATGAALPLAAMGILAASRRRFRGADPFHF